MSFYDLTTNDQIRSVLTVTEDDLDDSVIDSYGLDDDLGRFLDAVPDWEAIIAAPVKPRHLRSLKLAAKYFCAGTIGKKAQVFILKKSTDGSNEGQRSDKDGWAWLGEGLMQEAQDVIAELLIELGVEPEPVTPISVIAISIPDRDPIKTPRTAR